MEFHFAQGDRVRVRISPRAGAQPWVGFTGVIDELKVIPKETYMPWGIVTRRTPGYAVKFTRTAEGSTLGLPRIPQPFYEEELEAAL